MAQFPKLTRIPREEYAEAPSWFGRFLDTVSPFVSDVTGALSGGLDATNYRKQFATFTITTGASLESTFTGGKVSVSSKIGKPRKVTIARCAPFTLPTFAQETWAAPTMTGSWVSSASVQPIQYRLDSGGWVHLRGQMDSGVITSAAFTLPVGFRPAKQERFSTLSNSAGTSTLGDLVVSTAGVVTPFAGGNTFFSVDNVSFEAAPGTWVGIGPFGPPIWDYTQKGAVRINYIAGLSPLTKYEITLELE